MYSSPYSPLTMRGLTIIVIRWALNMWGGCKSVYPMVYKHHFPYLKYPFSTDASVQLQCSIGTIVANATTNPFGTFMITLDPSPIVFANILTGKCRLVVESTLAKYCNAKPLHLFFFFLESSFAYPLNKSESFLFWIMGIKCNRYFFSV